MTLVMNVIMKYMHVSLLNKVIKLLIKEKTILFDKTPQHAGVRFAINYRGDYGCHAMSILRLKYN